MSLRSSVSQPYGVLKMLGNHLVLGCEEAEVDYVQKAPDRDFILYR